MKTKTPEEMKAEIFNILRSEIYIAGACSMGILGTGTATEKVYELFKQYTLSLLPKMKPISEIKGFNMKRLLLLDSHGYMTTGFYKDGMIQFDGSYNWHKPEEFESFILLEELKNNLNT